MQALDRMACAGGHIRGAAGAGRVRDRALWGIWGATGTRKQRGRSRGKQTLMTKIQLAIDGLAAALEASGRSSGHSYTSVHGRADDRHDVATFTFRFPPGWVMPKDVEAFVHELHEQLRAEWQRMGLAEEQDPRTRRLLDLAQRMLVALRQDEGALQAAITNNVLRDQWPAGVVTAAQREIEAVHVNLRLERSMGMHWRRQHAALKARVDSLKRTRAMRINPVDPRRPA